MMWYWVHWYRDLHGSGMDFIGMAVCMVKEVQIEREKALPCYLV